MKTSAISAGTGVLVTGGCGFIGSHLVDRLVEAGCRVTVIDNLSAGSTEYLQPYLERQDFRFLQADIRDEDALSEALDGVQTVFHMAAQPDVRISAKQPLLDFDINVAATVRLLDRMAAKGVASMIFASSAGTIYGQTEVRPTPESHPLQPISHYGATKAAAEMFLCSYASMSGLSCVALRYGNIFGPRSTHGVMHDFFFKLRDDPGRLEILGDGRQNKTYLYIEDCAGATLQAAAAAKPGMNAYNISAPESVMVRDIAAVMVDELGLKGVQFQYSGGRSGWAGDVTVTLADVTAVESIGWRAGHSILEGVRLYTRWLCRRYGDMASGA